MLADIRNSSIFQFKSTRVVDLFIIKGFTQVINSFGIPFALNIYIRRCFIILLKAPVILRDSK